MDMTAKEKLLKDLVSSDKSGATQRTHDYLISLGFKWKERGNTLMYHVKGRDSKELGLIAMRRGLVSFPKNFWENKPSSLNKAMNSVTNTNRIHLAGGPFTSDQYSAGQVALDSTTESMVRTIIKEIVIAEGELAGAVFKS
jgi:hypothetical protein